MSTTDNRIRLIPILLHSGACVTGLLFTQEAKHPSFVELAKALHSHERATGWIDWMRSVVVQLVFESSTRTLSYDCEAPFEKNLPTLEWMERILLAHPALPKIPVTMPYRIDPIVTRKQGVTDTFGLAKAVLGDKDQLSYTELAKGYPPYALSALPSMVNVSDAQTLALVGNFCGKAGQLIATIERLHDVHDFPLEVNTIKVRTGTGESLLHFPTTEEELSKCEMYPAECWWRERP